MNETEREKYSTSNLSAQGHHWKLNIILMNVVPDVVRCVMRYKVRFEENSGFSRTVPFWDQ